MSSPENSLPRKFGFWTGVYVVAANMIGAGILTTSGPVLRNLQSPSLLIALWIVGAILSMFGALTLAEMGSGLPHVGGDYVFVRKGLGKSLAFVYGWAMVLLGFAAPLALISYTTGNYLYPYIHSIFGSDSWFLSSPKIFSQCCATLLLIAFTNIHSMSHESSRLTQGLTTLFKILVLVLLSLAIFMFSSQPMEFSSATTDVPFSKIGLSLIQIMYAYSGWNAAAYLAGEIKSADKLIPKCIIFGCFFVGVLYVIINLSYLKAINLGVLQNLSEDQIGRIAEVASAQVFGVKATSIISLLTSLGVLSSISSYILTGSRVCFAMAHDGIFPKIAKNVHSKRQTPIHATVFLCAMAIVFLWSGTFEEVLNFTGIGLAALSNLIVLPIFWLRKKNNYNPTFKVPFYPWTPILFLIVNNTMLIAGIVEAPMLAFWSIGSIAAAFPVYFLMRRLGATS